MPLQRRVPKHGFKNINRKEYKGINISTLEALAEKKKLKKIDVQILVDAGLASCTPPIRLPISTPIMVKIPSKAFMAK